MSGSDDAHGRPFHRHDNHPYACRHGICRPYAYLGRDIRLYLCPGRGACLCHGRRRILTWGAFGMTFWSAKETEKSDVVLPVYLECLESTIYPVAPWCWRV